VRVIVRSLGFAVLLVAASPVFRPVAAPITASRPMPPEAYWLEPAPEGDAETELHQAAVSSASPDAAAVRLQEIAERRGGTAGALARLGAGLVLLDLARPADALIQLEDPHIESRTRLGDHALLARALAHDRLGAFASAADAYRDGAARAPAGPRRCAALLRGAEVSAFLERLDEAAAELSEVLDACEGSEPKALLQLVAVQEKKGDRRAAAAAADRLDRDFPVSPEAAALAPRMKSLAAFLPPMTQEQRDARDGARALKLFEAERYKDAAAALRVLLARTPPPVGADVYRVRLGRALLANGKEKDGLAQLKAVPADAPAASEAAYYVARQQSRRARRPDAYAAVVSRFPGTSWAEEALSDQAHFYQKDARDEEALPYFRKLLQEFPEGRYADAATWRVAWGDRRQGFHAAAAERLEKAVAGRPRSSYTPGFLYWAGRSRRDLGQEDVARAHFIETVRRFKHAYHGLRAQEALGSGLPEVKPPDPGEPISDPERTRIRQLLLINRLAEALDETRGLPPTPQAQATRAWILWRQGQLRPAINAMRRAYPEYLGAGGDALPDPLWRILYPIQFEATLRAQAAETGLDPALLAALIWQESTFDPQAVSGVGARGLMQIMPRTGRELARNLGLKYRIDMLHEPDRGLELGTRYLKRMIDGFGGRVDEALAAYNAGPSRVASWTRARPGQSAEEFIEGIPFQETRSYVMTILANREHYRRIYGLSAGRPLDVASGR
jgi:soluble lytic murein transglycosylase